MRKFHQFIKDIKGHPFVDLLSVTCLLFIALFIAYYVQSRMIAQQLSRSQTQKTALSQSLQTTQKAYEDLKNQDQYKINQQLKANVDQIHTTYSDAVTAYQGIQDLRAQKQDTTDMEKLYAAIVKNLSDQNFASGTAQLKELTAQIEKKKAAVAAAQQAAASPGGNISSAPVSNNPPGSGYSFQQVKTDVGNFGVGIIAADLGSTRVIIDTASDGDCSNNCPTLPLATYVSRSGAFAGINGSYFCPAEYPSCAGKTNSFDTLLMNKNKVYFNSANNVYSNVPVAIFGSGYARFIGQSSGWGRDTSVDGVIANQPLLLSGGNVAFGGDSDPKKGSVGPRGFVANKGNMVYIGVVYNATVVESAYVMKALGFENALNLDSGGSTALWSGGYKAGPGRNIPNAVLFVRK